MKLRQSRSEIQIRLGGHSPTAPVTVLLSTPHSTVAHDQIILHRRQFAVEQAEAARMPSGTARLFHADLP
jgi:hypothetical protein